MRVIQSIVNQGHGSCSPTYLFVHSTANPGAPAVNHRNLYSRGYDYAVQYVCDWTGDVYHCVPDNRLAWAVGNGNQYGVSLEICEGTDQGMFAKSWDTAVAFCAWYLAQRGWGIDRMMSHNEARLRWGGTDHTDPDPYFNRYGRTWAQFKQAVSDAMAKGQKTVQNPGKAANDAGLYYRAHVQEYGWLDSVHDGQTAGTVGLARQLEALKFTPPEGVTLRVKAHLAGIGWKTYSGIRKGKSSGTGSSANDPIIGTVGEGRRIEALEISCTENKTGKKLKYRTHLAGVGWTPWVSEGYATGSVGLAKAIEAVQIKMV